MRTLANITLSALSGSIAAGFYYRRSIRQAYQQGFRDGRNYAARAVRLFAQKVS